MAGAQETIVTRHYFKSGSGFFVNLQGQVVTNAHVLSKDCTKVEIRAQGQSYPAQIVAYDEKRDLAVVQSHTYPGPSPLAVRDSAQPAREGEAALALGFPGDAATRDELRIAPSKIISGDTKTQDRADHYVTFTTSVAQGNSGGPLVDESGNVLGVVRGTGQSYSYNPATAKIFDTKDLDFAIGTRTLQQFLDENRISYQTRQSNTRWDKDLIRVRLLASVPNVRCYLSAPPPQ
jgi:serine protease Do